MLANAVFGHHARPVIWQWEFAADRARPEGRARGSGQVRRPGSSGPASYSMKARRCAPARLPAGFNTAVPIATGDMVSSHASELPA